MTTPSSMRYARSFCGTPVQPTGKLHACTNSEYLYAAAASSRHNHENSDHIVLCVCACAWMCVHCLRVHVWSMPGLKACWVIWIKYFVGQASLAWFIQHPDATWIPHWIMCGNNDISKHMNQACLMVMMETYLPILSRYLEGWIVQLYWTMHCCTPQKYSHYNHFQIFI